MENNAGTAGRRTRKVGAVTRISGSPGKTTVPSGTAWMSPVKRKAESSFRNSSSNRFSERR